MTPPTVTCPLVWIDLEMSGLDPRSCAILEIATVLTDGDLGTILEGPDIVVHQPDDVLDAMNEWCTEHHEKSGLTAAVRGSDVSLGDAERATVAFLSPHLDAGGAPLCGNSVGTDWRFLRRHMPALADLLGGRIIDVTTLKELTRRWYPERPPPKKADGHRALDDIRESIEELRFYRDHFLR